MFVPFEVGNEYKRSEIHDRFGGSRQSGISPSSQSPYIFIFTGEAGHQYGYHDRWEEDGELYLYAGDGQVGDMEFVRGNRAIRDHLRDGKQILLFQMHGKGRPVTFLGEFFCSGHRFVRGNDREGSARQVILFELRRQRPDSSAPAELAEAPATASKMALHELRALVLESQPLEHDQDPRFGRRRYYERSAAAAEYVRRRAAGLCEGCDQPAPFIGRDNLPYLEAHHIRRKADNGPDHPAWMVAICPNCHRRVHLGADGEAFNSSLRSVALQKESHY